MTAIRNCGVCGDSCPRLSGRAKLQLSSAEFLKGTYVGRLSPSAVFCEAFGRLSVVMACSSPAFRNSGNHHAQSPMTISVPTPPRTTACTVPNHCAVTPDSNCPNSFDVPIKIISTAVTRPRISSGVANWVSVARMITLIMSLAPSRNNAIRETVKLRDSPKRMVKIPNPPTAQSSVGPDFPRNGRCARSTAITAAPAPGAVRNNPSPHGPVCRISRAYTGSSATAPPKKHREKIERNRAQDQLLVPDVMQPREDCLCVIGSRGRALTSGLMRNEEIVAPIAVSIAIDIHRGRSVERRVHNSSKRRSKNRCRLKNGGVPCHGVREMFRWHQLRQNRPAGRAVKRSHDADQNQHDIDRSDRRVYVVRTIASSSAKQTAYPA